MAGLGCQISVAKLGRGLRNAAAALEDLRGHHAGSKLWTVKERKQVAKRFEAAGATIRLAVDEGVAGPVAEAQGADFRHELAQWLGIVIDVGSDFNLLTAKQFSANQRIAVRAEQAIEKIDAARHYLKGLVIVDDVVSPRSAKPEGDTGDTENFPQNSLPRKQINRDFAIYVWPKRKEIQSGATNVEAEARKFLIKKLMHGGKLELAIKSVGKSAREYIEKNREA